MCKDMSKPYIWCWNGYCMGQPILFSPPAVHSFVASFVDLKNRPSQPGCGARAAGCDRSARQWWFFATWKPEVIEIWIFLWIFHHFPMDFFLWIFHDFLLDFFHLVSSQWIFPMVFAVDSSGHGLLQGLSELLSEDLPCFAETCATCNGQP